eukprot:scaffold2868_cov171-Amphora_coffeaeformis.AAC.8
MDPMAWHKSVTGEASVFTETYDVTRGQILQAAHRDGYDCILEVGCGTGDVIGNLNTTLPRYGIDINERFIEHCQQNHDHDGCKYEVVDVLVLEEWWAKIQAKHNFQKPLVVCVNNTLPIMPEEIRAKALDQMIKVCGPLGRCVLSFWNGHFFSHAVMNFYKQNANLCGKFDMSHVDLEGRALETPTGYSTHWMTPREVQRLLRSYDVNISRISVSSVGAEEHPGVDHINTAGLAIFAWFSQDCTSNSKSYYDSDDAQTFYSSIWGEETVHIGRYDLLTEADKGRLSFSEQISKAEELHELEFVKRIISKFQVDKETPKMRILDMGCGYGGLLRRLWKEGLVWHATGCDISGKMCDKARLQNEKIQADKDIDILEESYLSVSIPDESVDLVISMDALLHIGPQGHPAVAKEASRCLRPGGWMIYCDIMEQEKVDSDEMQPIYDRIHLSKLGTVSHYESCLGQAGFTKFHFEPHSSNVASHYGTVRKVLEEKGDSLPISKEFINRMSAGLGTWEKLAPKNIVWGFVFAQKTEKVQN